MHAVLIWLVRVQTIGTGNDDAVYLLLGRALLRGSYRELFYIDHPIHSQYPPGYPVLLALVGAPLDGDLRLVIAANILLSCASLALLYEVVRRWSAPLATLVVAVLAFSPSLVLSASRVQSEPMFMAALMLALWALRPSASERLRWVAIGAVVIATLTRSAGLAVVLAIFTHFLLARAWRHAAALAIISILTIAPWLLWTAIAPQQVAGRSYIADALLTMPSRDSSGVTARSRERSEVQKRSAVERLARTLRVRLRHNTRHYVTRGLPTRLAVPTVSNTPVDNVAWLLVMLIGAGAGLAAAWSRWRVAVLALLAYAGLLLVWPYAVSRFLIPMLPVFAALLLLGTWRIGARFVPRVSLLPVLVLAALLLIGGTQSTAAMVRNRSACTPAEQEDDGMCVTVAVRYKGLAERVDALMPGSAPVFTTKEGTFFYHTGRPVVSVYPALGIPAERLAAYLRESGAGGIFLPHLRSDEVDLGPPLAELCESLTDARSPRDDVLILLVRDPRGDEQNACDAVARWRETW